MITGVEYVREECKKRGITIAQLEKDLGFSNGYLNPKKLKQIPYDRAKQIAQYLVIDINRIYDDEDVENNGQHKYYIDDTTAEILEAMAINPKLKSLYYMQRHMNEDEVTASTAFHNTMIALKQKEERLDQDDPC